MVSRTVLLGVVLAFVGAGCGNSEESRPQSALPPGLSREVQAASEAIGRDLDGNRGCAAAGRAASLQATTIEAINAGDVPGELQEELLGSVNELVESIPCPSGDEEHVEHARELADRLLELSGRSDLEEPGPR